MRQLAAVIFGIMMTAGVWAQGSTVTTTGGLTVDVPPGFLAAEVSPLSLGLSDPAAGVSIFIRAGIQGGTQTDILASEARRLGGQTDGLAVLLMSNETASALSQRVHLTAGIVQVIAAHYSDGSLALLTIRPADALAAPTLDSLIASVRLIPLASGLEFPLCGGGTLPQTLTTSGGLRVCFPLGFIGEEKSANTAGIANLQAGVVMTIYARHDLEALLNAAPADAESAASLFAETLRPGGAVAFTSALETLTLNAGQAVSLPVAYPGVGAGRIIAVGVPDGLVLLSAVLLGAPPADIVETLNAIAGSVALGEPSESLGEMRTAEAVVRFASGVTFTAAPGWRVTAEPDSMTALLQNADGSALLTVTAAPVDASWNAQIYKTAILPAAAQFAGDTAYDPATLEVIRDDPGLRVEVYDSARALPEATAAVNLTTLVTLDNRVMVVLQASISRAAYTDAVRSELLRMAESIVFR